MSALTREAALEKLKKDEASFDVLVVGGGITGAGIAREAAGSGLRTLLVEQQDFAWGTSSRSSKMVHGGLRYLGSGQIRLTRDAVQERNRLMAEAPGLIDPLPFVMPHYAGQFPGPQLFQLLLRLYDRLSGRQSRKRFNLADIQQWIPGVRMDDMIGASGFEDAVTDDARLVQRLLEEATADGALCLNYIKASCVVRSPESNAITGITLADCSNDSAKEPPEFTVKAPVIINATGAWADQLRSRDKDNQHIRPLRGSHLVVPFRCLPVSCSVSLMHPKDKRPVFAFPWQGATVLGTTDLDHSQPLTMEPFITQAEVDDLLELAATLFPGAKLSERDILATWAGVRPVVSDGKSSKPSSEKRDHQIWDDNGLISVAGGKLTTFRLIAREVLEHAMPLVQDRHLRSADEPVFSQPPQARRPAAIGHLLWRRLVGYYGPRLPEVLQAGPTEPIAGTQVLWAEVAWAAASGTVVHLDDLMLRRTRLGLLLPDGGRAVLPGIRDLCQTKLGWDSEIWAREEARYLRIVRTAYSLPEPTTP